MAVTINASTTAGLVQTADTSGVLALQTAGTTAVSISASQVVTLTNALAEASGGTGTTIGYNGFKNRIINGAMVIDQRNAGASVTLNSGDEKFPIDRFSTYQITGTGVVTAQQSSTAPTGFTNSIKLTTTTANASLSAAQRWQFLQSIEGYNTADLGFGTANAKTVNLSFWVYSSLTGTFAGSLNNSAIDRSYVFNYTISNANTWEQKTITIAGDTSGTWVGATNGIGIRVYLSLGAGTNYNTTAGAWASGFFLSTSGATSVVGTNGATFYITGVQLEKGSTATSFDYRPIGTELALAQRYYFQYAAATASNDFQEIVTRTSLTGFDSTTYLPVTMRSTPTLVLPSGSTYGRLVGFDSAFAATAPNVTAMSVSANNSSLSAIHLAGTNVSMTFAQGQGSTSFDTNNISVGLGLSAEL